MNRIIRKEMNFLIERMKTKPYASSEHRDTITVFVWEKPDCYICMKNFSNQSEVISLKIANKDVDLFYLQKRKIKKLIKYLLKQIENKIEKIKENEFKKFKNEYFGELNTKEKIKTWRKI